MVSRTFILAGVIGLLAVSFTVTLHAQNISPNGWIRQSNWSALYLDTQCGNGNATCDGCGPAGDVFDGAGHFDTDWLGGAVPEAFVLIPGVDIQTLNPITLVGAGETGPSGFRGGSVVHALSTQGNPNNDTVDHDGFLGAIGENTDDAYAISQTVINNVSGADKLVSVCTGSDDSIILVVDTTQIHARSVCRGSADCQESSIVLLPPGEHVITAIIHEGGGGFNHRIRLEDSCGPVTPGGDIEFLGQPTPAINVVTEATASAEELGECPFATDAFGNIFAKNFTMLFPLANPFSADGGGAVNMAQTNWVAPHDITAEDPKGNLPVGNITAWDDMEREHLAADTLGLDGAWVTHSTLEALGVPNLNPGADIVNYQQITEQLNTLSAVEDIPNDNVLGVSTLYVMNKTGAPMDVGICTASDDSIQVWVNRQLVTNVSQPRGTAAGCAEINPALLLPGLNKLALLNFEGGGGWGQRLRIIKGDGVEYVDSVDGIDSLEIIGPAHPDYAAAATPEAFALNDREVVEYGSNCPDDEVHVTLTGNGLNDLEGIDVTERLSAADLTEISADHISHGGQVVLDVIADSDPALSIGAFPQAAIVGTDAGGVSLATDNGGGSYTSTSSTGGDIWTGGDSFVFQYDLIAGDFEVAIELENYAHATGAGRWGKFGLMARQTDDPGDGTVITGETARRFAMTKAHGPDPQDNVQFTGRAQDGVANGGMFENAAGLEGLGNFPRFIRLTRRGNVFQGWASNDEGLGDGTKNPCNDGNWNAGATMDWGDGAPATLAVGFANSEHNSNGAVAQTIDYQILACVTGLQEPITGVSVQWTGLTAAEVNQGLSYDLAYGLEGTVSIDGVVSGGQVGRIKPNNAVSFKPQSGPVGVFDTAHDFGGVNFAGDTVYNSGDDSYTVSGSGPDIWSSADNMQFAYTKVTGDFDAQVRVVDVQHPLTGRWGRYGLMARYRCDVTARHSFAMHTAGFDAGLGETGIDIPRHQFRPVDAANSIDDSQQVDDGTLPPGDGVNGNSRRPPWLRLVRKGPAVFSYMSFSDENGDPVGWCQTGADVDVNRPAELLLGLAVGSHGTINNQELVTVTFDNFSIDQGETLAKAFLFGSRNLTCPVFNDPSQDYTMVHHSGNNVDAHEAIAYEAGRGWGYEKIYEDPDLPYGGRNGSGQFGPFDDSPNNRNKFADECPEQIYDSFIGTKNYLSDCDGTVTGDFDSPCDPPEGVIFRVDVPNGFYKFVAVVGDADNPHVHRLLAEDGGSGPPEDIGGNSVALIPNFDQSQATIGQVDANRLGEGVFGRTRFGSKATSPGDGASPEPQFVDFPSPVLEVTQGYVRIHQLQGNSNPGPGADGGQDRNGADLVILELWQVPAEDAVECIPAEVLVDAVDYDTNDDLGVVVVRGGGFTPAAIDGRLRLSEENIGGSATAVWYGIPAAGDPSALLLEGGFKAEFDAFMTRESVADDPGTPDVNEAQGCTQDPVGDPNPADGMTFAVVATGVSDGLASALGPWPPGLDVQSLGGDAGGSQGYNGGTLRQRSECHPSFAVEMDNWVGGGNNEPGGSGSPDADCFWHIGLDVGGYVDSIQTNVDMGVGPAALPDIYSPDGVHVEVVYENTGQIDVWVTANDGSVPRTLVISSSIAPLPAGDAVLGFTAGTGGATATQEIDNLTISALCCELPDSVSISGPAETDTETPVTYSASFTGADAPVGYAWTASGAAEIVGAADGETVEVQCTGEGAAQVSVAASDGVCEDPDPDVVDLNCVCPAEGDTRCLGLVVEPGDGPPGPRTVTVTAEDDSGDEILYTITATSVAGDVLTSTENPATIDLGVGVWTISASVDDDPDCPDEDAGATCDPPVTVKTGSQFIRGDCNQDGRVCGDPADIIRLVQIIYLGFPAPECPAACDADGDGDILTDDQEDIFRLVNYCFLGTASPPPAPFPECGDPSPTETCEGSTFCSP